MTTELERISRLEGIVERTNATLDSIERRLEALHAEMLAGDAALSAQMQALSAKMDSIIRMMFFASVALGIALIGAIITFILRF